MHLSSITLSGFKTFARTTEIRFERGITAIVGPNGSGKTNIVDAFKWVLGETQARDLRGKKMEEVIYAGGERRPRASSAEVTIVIDNGDRRLPVDYEEVAIRRRVDRSGQSDYFLNGSRVRRRDLMELLSSTGLTTDSYAIVDQRDIESIISSLPAQRRQLIEEAAQVRGVKAKRTEAADKLRDLAQNLLRLEDLRGEIEPRLQGLRSQRDVFREAQVCGRRLELLRGSLVWEEWREARDGSRRAQSQSQSLQRRLDEARLEADAAEAEFKRWRLELEAAQDRRLQRQKLVGGFRLELSAAEHELELAVERARNQSAQAAAAVSEESELALRAETARALKQQLEGEIARTRAELTGVPATPAVPQAADAAQAGHARRAADSARRAAAGAAAALATARTRRQFVEESVRRLHGEVVPAEQALDAAEKVADDAAAAARAASGAASELVRLRAELEGLESLRPQAAPGLKRLGDVIVPEPGWEAALSAVLGAMVDAWVAPDAGRAQAAANPDGGQATILYALAGAAVRPGSLFARVRCDPGHEELGRMLLGSVSVTGGEPPSVTSGGVYREPGLVRAGQDPRVALALRHRELSDRAGVLLPQAESAERLAEKARLAEQHLNDLRFAAGGRRRLDESIRQLEAARQAEAEAAANLPELERTAAVSEELAIRLGGAVVDQERLHAEHRAEVRRLELERLRWQERATDLERQLGAVASDLAGLDQACALRQSRAQSAQERAAAAESGLVALGEAVARAEAALAQAEAESPEEDAELAEGARRLVALEEARVDARLKAGALEGSLGLIAREAELAQARMEEIRTRLPEGLAPEEIPGGRAREREMRQLERRLDEIGPTNALAEVECAELEERYRTLQTQLEDIEAARLDLDDLVRRLRDEEETRYDAVFGAVAANFQELFAELTDGGRATLRHVAGDDGPRSGVEILVQPPRKRLQNLTLLSSGERSLTALALVLALEEVNPSPFTILDEVDAALDDANVGRFGEMLRKLGHRRQLLAITHNHLTMACAASLYGIHLDESGASHLVSVRLEDVRPKRQNASVSA